MNIFATSSGQARRAAGPARVAIPAAAAIAALALTGCSARSLAATGASAAKTAKAVKTVTMPPSTPPASAPVAQPSTPTAAATPATTPTATASPTAPPPQPQPGALTATVTILGPATGLVPGGSPVRFLVTVTNHASQPFSNIAPLVSLGHCTCTSSASFPTATFEYRVALSPATSAQVTRGTGALDVTLIQLPGHHPVGQAPSASTPVDIQSGQPPA